MLLCSIESVFGSACLVIVYQAEIFPNVVCGWLSCRKCIFTNVTVIISAVMTACVVTSQYVRRLFSAITEHSSKENLTLWCHHKLKNYLCECEVRIFLQLFQRLRFQSLSLLMFLTPPILLVDEQPRKAPSPGIAE